MERNSRSRVLAALEELHDQQGETVYRYLLGTLGCREDAEDAMQTIWYQLARRSTRLLRVEDLPAYLWSAARNQARSIFRSRGRHRYRLDDDTEPDLLPAAGNAGVDRDELRDLRRAIAGLPFRQRELAVLVGIEGFTIKEAADRLGIPQGTAAGRYRAALKGLKKRLGEEDG